MKIQFKKIEEAGYKSAIWGLSLSHEQNPESMTNVAMRLINPKLQDSHKKYLRQMMTWWDVWLSRDLWAEFDTYRYGVEKQSGSTMYNLLKRPVVVTDFLDDDMEDVIIQILNGYRDRGDLVRMKRRLPESYMQHRGVMLGYQAIQHIVTDRKHHKLPEWTKDIIAGIRAQIDHPEFIVWE